MEYNWWQTFLHACITVLGVLLARAGLNGRIVQLKAEQSVMHDALKAQKDTFDEHVRQLRVAFRNEVQEIVRPINEQMNTISADVAELTSICTTLLHRGQDDTGAGDAASKHFIENKK